MSLPRDGEVRYLYGFSSHHPRLSKIKGVYHVNRSYEEVTGQKETGTGLTGAPFVNQWAIYDQGGVEGDGWRLTGRNTTEGLDHLLIADPLIHWWTSREHALAQLIEWCAETVKAKASQLADAKWNLDLALRELEL